MDSCGWLGVNSSDKYLTCQRGIENFPQSMHTLPTNLNRAIQMTGDHLTHGTRSSKAYQGLRSNVATMPVYHNHPK